MKRQEACIHETLDHCSNIKLWLWIGSSFDYHIGYQKRAPKIWRSLGFEWLYRIFTSPNKLKRLRRIYQALIVFPIRVLLYKK
jgi:exopolysaccharide biosynthesis WecB/TagA/CpsF family protein